MAETLERRLGSERFFLIDADLPVDTSLRSPGGVGYGETAGMAMTAHLWAFTAEVVAACTRLRRMPAIWPSGAIPQFEAWEQRYANARFHDDCAVPPIAAGVLGRRYLEILREQVQACAGSATQVAAAARMLAAVPASNGVYAMVESHLLAGESALPVELPDWLLVQRTWRWPQASRSMRQGDAALWIGTFAWPSREIASAQSSQHPFVAVTLEGPGEAPRRAPLDGSARIAVEPSPAATAAAAAPPGTLWVPAPWQYPDAVLNLEAYPLPICPTSSVVNGVLLWSIVGSVLDLRGPTPKTRDAP
jgi:hypothetical protein